MSLERKEKIRIEEIALRLDEDESLLMEKIAVILGLAVEQIIDYKVVKRAIDSRKKNDILLVYSLDVALKNPSLVKVFNARHRVRKIQPFVYEIKKIKNKGSLRPLVVGSGPCGLFAALALAKAGLKPLVIERGADVDSRVKDIEKFFQEAVLNPQSNVQFGEGGAGTFSDGKLYTLINDPRSAYIFSELISAGAPDDIAYNSAPHIGTDKLRAVIKNLRLKIIALGGEFRFNTCLTGIKSEEGCLVGAILNGQEEIAVREMVLAIGHSARDTYKMLFEAGVDMKQKPFSMGLRIEHHATAIDSAQYGFYGGHKKLGPAKYKLVQHLKNNRSVYTFCMCPGGYVMGAASEEGGVVTNGMSEYARDGENSNSALLVSILPEDFASNHPLAGVDFQRQWERKSFEAGGSDYKAPAQLVGDFLAGRPSTSFGQIKPTYKPGVKMTSLENCLPDFVLESLRLAIPLLDKKVKGFSCPEAVLTGPETRSSSPLRINRGEDFLSNLKGLYPAGEGAGYAGGIVSSAIDGLAVAEAIVGCK